MACSFRFRAGADGIRNSSRLVILLVLLWLVAPRMGSMQSWKPHKRYEILSSSVIASAQCDRCSSERSSAVLLPSTDVGQGASSRAGSTGSTTGADDSAGSSTRCWHGAGVCPHQQVCELLQVSTHMLLSSVLLFRCADIQQQQQHRSYEDWLQVMHSSRRCGSSSLSCQRPQLADRQRS